MFDWLIQMAASAAGVPQETLDKIDKAMPATKALIDLLNKHQALIVTAQALVKQAAPLVPPALDLWAQVQPLVPQIQEEIADIMPAAKAIQAGKSTAEASASVANAIINAHHGGHG